MDNPGDVTDADAALALTQKALRQSGRESKWWQIELEHTTESLQRARRQRARLRDQVDVLSEALATVLSEAYWSSQPASSGVGRLLGRGAPGTPEADLVREIESSGLFDGAWYLRAHAKVARSGLSPAVHYTRHGNAKKLDPGPGFDTADYLRRHPDAADSGLPALVHAIRHGHLDEPHDDDAASPAHDLHL